MNTTRNLLVSVYRSDSDCTGGGITSKESHLTLWAEDATEEEILAELISMAERKLELAREGLLFDEDGIGHLTGGETVEDVVERMKPCQLILVNERDYKYAREVFREKGVWYMFGGNFVKTCDSRWAELTGCKYPIGVHDRTER